MKAARRTFVRGGWLVWLAASSVVLAESALAQRGQFDKTPVDPRDEAYIFTPRGFDKPGVPAEAKAPDAAHLRVTVVDAATGEPTFCRVNVVGADGNFYQPAEHPLADYSLTGTWPERLAGNRTGKAPIRYFGHFFYTPGEFTVAVPPGRVRVEVWKGFEYRPRTREIELAAGATGDVKLRLERTADVARRGWYSGDPHLHFIRAGDRDERTIFDLLEAEDMRFGMVLAYNETNAYPGVMPELATPQLRGLGLPSVRSRGGYQIISGQEYRNVVSGHMLLFLRDSLVLDGQRIDPNLGPVFGEIGAETQQQGGYAFHAHGGYSQEIWADLVQEATNGVELLQFGIYRGIGLDGWYRALNCGFRFPGIGACDYPACRKLGDCRTYARIEGEPDFSKWFASAAAGRSFMTSGPLVLLDVAGKQPGDILTTGDDKPLALEARVVVQSETAPVTDVQLVVNGRVVHAMQAKPLLDEPQELVLEKTIEVGEPAWIAARAFSKSPTASADAEAHTNPVYVYLNGRRPYSAADADWLIERLDEQIADHEARDVPERAAPIAYFRRSREIVLALKQAGGLPAGGVKDLNVPAPKAKEPESDTKEAAREAADDALSEVLKPVPAKSPEEALATFEVQDGFRMELVAHEPDVVDPVAACFDENGGMYVAEMIDYPYRPKDSQPLGRVRYLVDEDGDGRYERSFVFADRLAWPTGLACWKGGVYVAAAPDIWYCRDTDGDHVADERQQVYTGFGDRNQQGMVNNLAWGIDHHIYGAGSTNGGEVRLVDRGKQPPIVLSGRDFRFDPVTGTFETVTGSRQFGNAFDDWFNRFICSESKPLFHVVLPERQLARNPYLAVPGGLEDLAPGVTPIFRTSPIEKWREIRSNRRTAAGERAATSAGLSHHVIDAAAGLTVYRGHAYPPQYRGQVFVGCSQNNLIHRRRLIPQGVTFRSERIDEQTEFVRSTDTWFRPVNCINAPDGTLYVLDMSREVIESIHIAQDVVRHLDLTSGRDKGRIYRLAPPGFKPAAPPRLAPAATAELVRLLEHESGWWRDTASRLIFERQDRSIVAALRERLRAAPAPAARMHILYALAGLDSLTDEDLAIALADVSPRVRDHAVRLASARLSAAPQLLERLLGLASDADAGVKFQLAFALGETADPRAVAALATIATGDAEDAWMRTAVLSSSASSGHVLLAALVAKPEFLRQPSAAAWCEQLGAQLAARGDAAAMQRGLDAAAELPAESPARRAIVHGLAGGLRRKGQSLSDVTASASAAAAGMLTELVETAARAAQNRDAALGDRSDAVRLLGNSGRGQTVEILLALVDPAEPESLQTLAVETLATIGEAKAAGELLERWPAATPAVQEAILAALCSRAAWAGPLLDACAGGRVAAGQVGAARRAALLQSSDPGVRARAERLFATSGSPRGETIARYRAALELSGDAARGEQVYQRECQSCHRLGERGFQVGPNLALVRNRADAAMLEAILDPNREVQPNYVNYVVVDKSGRTMTGLILSESAGSLTLGRDKGATETVLKSDIEQIQSTGKSLMPEELEKNIDVQGMADLLAFLKSVQYDVGTLPDFAEPEGP
jgi:putative membrane-bound dehydrogenase-like protein